MFMCDVSNTQTFAHNFVTLNYCQYTHSDVSIRLNGEDDNVVRI